MQGKVALCGANNFHTRQNAQDTFARWLTGYSELEPLYRQALAAADDETRTRIEAALRRGLCRARSTLMADTWRSPCHKGSSVSWRGCL